MLVIGSTALNFYATVRKPADLDLLCTKKEMHAFCIRYNLKLEHRFDSHWIVYDAPGFRAIEFQTSLSPAVAAYLGVVSNPTQFLDVYGEKIPVAPLDVLFSLKRSHRFLARHWEKHVRDYHLIKDLRSGELDAIPEITKLKEAETRHKHGPSLNKSKDEFFKDDVSNHTFEHDQIHEVMAHRERPMFEYIADSSSGTVKSSKKLFFELPEIDQIRCVLEEAYVIALERGIIPMLYEGKKLADSKTALQWAIMRIGTTLTSGWFREFTVENYPAIWSAHDSNYVEKFLTTVDQGKIKQICEYSV